MILMRFPALFYLLNKFHVKHEKPVEEKGDEIIVRMKKTEDFGPSKSGKTRVIASTEGFTKINGFSLNLNLVKKA